MSGKYKFETILVFTINGDVIVDHILTYLYVFNLCELNQLLILDGFLVLPHDQPLKFKKYHQISGKMYFALFRSTL